MATRRSTAKKAEASDLEILHPDRTLKIAGKEITIREYGFVEGQRLLPIAEPFLSDLASAIAGSVPPSYRQISALIGKHIDAVVRLAAVSAGVEPEWIESLEPDDGTGLLMVWWAVNGPFYLRSVVQSIVIERALSGGATSTQS